MSASHPLPPPTRSCETPRDNRARGTDPVCDSPQPKGGGGCLSGGYRGPHSIRGFTCYAESLARITDMGDTGSEGSKPPSNVNVIPPRCPCGFWGSSKTMNLCSKCFADIQKKQPDDDCASKASSSSSSSQADIFCTETNSGISQSLMSMPNTSEDPSPGESGATSLPAQDEVSTTDTVFSSLSTPTKRSFESASESESDVSTEKRARVGEVPEGEESSSSSSSSSASSSSSSSSSSSRSGSKQRSRKRCHRCQTKLELVQQELGSCRCGYVFCMLHRLPEQHECLFDHLGRGRQEAVMKMVKLDRKVGRSCQRIGEECS